MTTTANNKSFRKCKQRSKYRCPYLYKKGHWLTCTCTNTALYFSELRTCPEIAPEDPTRWKQQPKPEKIITHKTSSTGGKHDNQQWEAIG
jgi:hypothetical protein